MVGQDHDPVVPERGDPGWGPGAVHRPGRPAGPDLCRAAAGVVAWSPGGARKKER